MIIHKLNLFNCLAVALTMLLVGVCICFYRTNLQVVNGLTKQKKLIETEISGLETSVEELKGSLKSKEAYATCLDKMTKCIGAESKNFMPKIILDLANHVFEDIFLSELRVDEAIYIRGYAQNMQIIVDLLHNLSNLPYICIGKIVELKTGSIGKTFLEFVIKLDFNPCKEVDDGKNKKIIGSRS